MSFPVQDVVISCSTADSCLCCTQLRSVDSLGETFVKKQLFEVVKDASDFGLEEHLRGPPPAPKCFLMKLE